MERNEIKVIVVGISASGKTTIGKLITDFLKEKGFDTKQSGYDEHEEYLDKNIDKKIDALKDKNLKIEVIERHYSEPLWIKRNLSE